MNGFGIRFGISEGNLETPPDGVPRQDGESDLPW